MFSRLSDQLQQTFKNLRGQGRITEANISEALREVRLHLVAVHPARVCLDAERALRQPPAVVAEVQHSAI